MRTVILISSNDREILNLAWQWKNKATNIYLENNTLNMVINGERIYIDCLENGEDEYEDEELADIDICKPSFYSICYSNRDEMKYFIQNSVFSKDSFMDNDLGRIMHIEELKKTEILNFIQ